jgi:hypothetical protein
MLDLAPIEARLAAGRASARDVLELIAEVKRLRAAIEHAVSDLAVFGSDSQSRRDIVRHLREPLLE